jgi:hypothetical protein
MRYRLAGVNAVMIVTKCLTHLLGGRSSGKYCPMGWLRHGWPSRILDQDKRYLQENTSVKEARLVRMVL